MTIRDIIVISVFSFGILLCVILTIWNNWITPPYKIKKKNTKERITELEDYIEALVYVQHFNIKVIKNKKLREETLSDNILVQNPNYEWRFECDEIKISDILKDPTSYAKETIIKCREYLKDQVDKDKDLSKYITNFKESK